MYKTEKVIGLGTAAIGRPVYINIKKDEDDYSDLTMFKNKGIDLLDYSYDQGFRHFDTAPNYGMAEQMLIDFIQMKKYEDISVSTKWGYTYTANYETDAVIHEVKDHSLDKLNEQWNQSKNLLPYLKLYQIHSVTPESNVLDNQEVLFRLHQLKKDHNIAIGITTSGPNQIDIIKKALKVKVSGEALFTSFQVTFNILDQSLLSINSMLHDKQILIKEAMANGRLLPNKRYNHYGVIYNYLSLLAEKYQATEDAIAIAYCMQGVDSDIVLSGVNNRKYLDQNIKAKEVKFSDLEIETLKSFAIDPETYWEERKLLEWN